MKGKPSIPAKMKYKKYDLFIKCLLVLLVLILGPE